MTPSPLPPAALAELARTKIRTALGLFASCIKSGESWTGECESAQTDAFVALAALVAQAQRGAEDVPTALIHEADGLLSLVAHRYRVHEIPRDLCDQLIACSRRFRNVGDARKLAARSPTPRPETTT